jgi:hypothetical protein
LRRPVAGCGRFEHAASADRQFLTYGIGGGRQAFVFLLTFNAVTNTGFAAARSGDCLADKRRLPRMSQRPVVSAAALICQMQFSLRRQGYKPQQPAG